MRPARLEVSGFACYAAKQTIDFSELSLFAIAGPTGAGKSTILDAIALALYGRVPRLGGKNLTEFISLGAASASITLDFYVGPDRYRVTQVVNRKGGRKSFLDHVTASGVIGLADQVREVEDRVQKLLGLGYDAFLQSVLLAQGEFARFLKSTPKDQREILTHLLRLGLYEQMRKLAGERASVLSTQIESARAQLNGPYLLATAEAVERLEHALVALAEQRAQAAAQLEQREAHRKQLHWIWDRVRQRQAQMEKLAALDATRPAMTELAGALDRARRAAQVVPLLEAAATRDAARRDAATTADRLRETLDSARTRRDNRRRDRDAVAREAEALPDLENRAMALAAVIPLVADRQTWAAKGKQARASMEAATGQIRDADARFDKAVADLEACAEKSRTLRERRAELGYDAIAHERLKLAHAAAIELAHTRRDLMAAEPLAGTAQQAAQEAASAAAVAAESRRRAEAEHQDAGSRHRALQHANMASVLRTGLEPGCECPVCAQPIAVPPPAAATAAKDLAGAAKAEERASQAAEKARRAEMAAAGESARLAARSAELAAGVEKLRKRAGALETDLVRGMFPLAPPAAVQPEIFAQDQLAAFDRLAGELKRIDEDANALTLQHAQLTAQRSDAEQAAARARDQREAASAAATEAEAKVRDCDARLAAAGAKDPERDLRDVRAEIAGIRNRQAEAESSYLAADRAVADAERDWAVASTRSEEAASAHLSAADAVRDALVAAGFSSEGAARSAALPPADMAAAEARVKAFHSDADAARSKLSDLDAELEDSSTSEEEVQTADLACTGVRDALAALDRETGVQSARLESLRHDVVQAEKLRAGLVDLESNHAVQSQLATDLRGANFQKYLLDGSFQKLAAGASLRLRQLNERYELQFDGGLFKVIDHDHGGETRLADTLSGGETFLASLALALELSEQVQQAAGAVRLDSLFIDEGFGTLDPETLETVAGAIESLGRSNRLVGVITHVPELHRRLPRLEVRPGPAGSTVEFVPLD